MHLLRPALGCALGVALVAAGSLPARAAGDDVSVSEAAQRLTAIRAERKAAEARIAAAQAQAQEATTALQVADEHVTAAQAVDRVTGRRADEAAAVATKATGVETRAVGDAREAEKALSRAARNAYINAMSNSDLELFAGFAADGPEALVNIARRDMAFDNIGDASLVTAQRTVRVASEAKAAAAEARSVYDDAQAEHAAARADLQDARAESAAATADLRRADQAEKSAAGDVRATDARYERAQDVYKSALKESLAGAPPISSGPAAEIVWATLKKEGFSEESIAGILGNLQQESGIDPTVVQSNGVGHGLAQWSAGGRWDNGSASLISFASANALDPWDARTQVRFMIYEMESSLGGFDIDMFKDMTDVLDATVYFHDVYEGSADSADFVRAVRGSYALQWYARLS